MIHLRCRCGSELQFPAGLVGEAVECPACESSVRMVAGGNADSSETAGERLIILRGPARVGEQIVLLGDGPIGIGKLPQQPIALTGNRVSRNHCRLVRDGTSWRIEDLKSTNGLYVNGTRASQRKLQPGDVLRIGDYEMEYLPGGSTQDPAEAEGSSTSPTASDEFSLAGEDALYELAEMENTAKTFDVPPPAAAAPRPIIGGVPCPSCQKMLPPTAKICIDCGIDAKTGRAILIRHALDENQLCGNAETAIRFISWIVPLGIYPVASEGFGTKKPYVVMGIAALTLLVSVLVWGMHISDPQSRQTTKDLMLWAGREPTAGDIEIGYATNRYTHWGDTRAFEQHVEALEDRGAPENEAIVKAYGQLSPGERCFGTFHWYQLITHGFLHANILHLAGNLLFLLVFGSRVNALIGHVKTLILYPVLMVAAGVAEMTSLSGHRPLAALGASGAIMGLAGMYLVLFPVHRVYMAFWLRFGLLLGFKKVMKIWAVRGFWVVLFFIAFDVLATVLGSKDGVAHWAHLGGFITGMVIALGLLLARQVDAHGGDLLSVTLGRRAWALLGRPGQRAQTAQATAAPALQLSASQ